MMPVMNNTTCRVVAPVPMAMTKSIVQVASACRACLVSALLDAYHSCYSMSVSE